MRGIHLSVFYYRLKQKHGGKKAAVAVARKMLVIIYHLLKNGIVYDEKKYEIPKQRQELNQFKRLTSNAKKLGYSLVPIETVSLVV